MGRALDVVLGVALGGSAVALFALLRRRARRPVNEKPQLKTPSASERQPVNQKWAVPEAQLAPSEFENADDDGRLARRIETVLRRRTGRVVVVLERLCDGHNFSAIFRTCEALGVQHVWLIAPPAERFKSTQNVKREFREEKRKMFEEQDARRLATERDVEPTSRRGRKREKIICNDNWQKDSMLDEEHAAHARGAARFLTIREFETSTECLDALRKIPDCELWATDLGQGAQVLAPDAPWIAESGGLPPRVALLMGTEGLGLSDTLLTAADRRVYVPQNGFADSLNVGVATALALSQILTMYGPDACGDVAREEDCSFRTDSPSALRASWSKHLARDEVQLLSITAKLKELTEEGLLHDLRRPPEFRLHTGKGKKKGRGAGC